MLSKRTKTGFGWSLDLAVNKEARDRTKLNLWIKNPTWPWFRAQHRPRWGHAPLLADGAGNLLCPRPPMLGPWTKRSTGKLEAEVTRCCLLLLHWHARYKHSNILKDSFINSVNVVFQQVPEQLSSTLKMPSWKGCWFRIMRERSAALASWLFKLFW